MKTMSKWIVLQRVLWVALAVAGSVGVVGYLRWAMRIDPFARFRPTDGSGPNAMQVAVQLRDVRLWNWDEGKLVLSCDMGRVDIHRDRQHLDFYNVSDGVYRGDKSSFHFSGPKAIYNAGLQLFEVNKGARVWNKDIDLKAESLKYRQQLGRLTTEGAVTGRVFDGEASAMAVSYYPETKLFEAGPISWEGHLPDSFRQEAGTDTSKPWQIKAAHGKHEGDTQTYDIAEATDGEIIVKAPKLERNVKTDVLTCTGRVEYYSKKANLICDKAVIYRKEKRAVLTGNVTMLIKPEDQEKLEVVEIQPFRPEVPDDVAATRPKAPGGQRTDEQKKQEDEVRSNKNTRKYPISMRAERIEYWYKKGDRHAIVTGDPQARQEFPNARWRKMWTNKAYYDGEKETLKLVSSENKKDTRVITSVGDDLVAKTFETSTKDDGEDHWSGDEVEGTVISNDEDLNNRNTKSGGSGSKPPPSGLHGNIGRKH
jgi:lipopolysaccharide export system protein LptA